MALKQISTSEVEMGMFIHSFEGSWLSHPFWRARFLIEDDDRLHAVRDSALDGVVIDTARGKDVPSRDMPASLSRAAAQPAIKARAPDRPAPAAQPAPSMRAAMPRPGSVSVAREFGNAKKVAGQARKVISQIFIEARLGKSLRVSDVTPVVEDIYASIERNPHAFSGLMRCKAEMEAVYQHMLSVSALMVCLARAMRMGPQEIRTAGTAGLLLDVGVSRLDIDFMALNGKLDDVDETVWHRHCYASYDMLSACDDVPAEVLHAALRHHERMDGAGFPQKLTDRELDTFSRMAAICDRFDLLVAGAATGEAVDPAAAMGMMMGMDGAFDGDILARFREALGVYPVGSFVTLRSGRVAMVIDQDPSEPALPTVRAFYSAITGKNVAGKTIALADCFGVDAITGVADLAELGLPPAEELREQLFAAAK